MPRELLRPMHGEDVSYMEQAMLPVCIITELLVSHESPQVSNRTSFHQPNPQGGYFLPTEPREQNVLLKTCSSAKYKAGSRKTVLLTSHCLQVPSEHQQEGRKQASGCLICIWTFSFC